MKSLILIAVISLVVYTTCEDCECPVSESPVCGVDYVTYGNECSLNCAGVEKLADFACPLCLCFFIYDPVCDTNGNLYANECILNCFGATINHGICEKRDTKGQQVKQCIDDINKSNNNNNNNNAGVP